jgi:2-keto-3-deoxy-L-arabinonate dehydratase
MHNTVGSLPTIAGVHCVLYALFDRQECIDLGQMREQVEIVLQGGVAGIMVLGLATEVSKLTVVERVQLMRTTGAKLAGRLPFSVTINGSSVAEQSEQVRIAADCGADWLILQPPSVGTYPASEYIDFFGRVADVARKPVAIQNAPAYFGRGLTAEELHVLLTRHPAVKIVKGEGPAVDIEQMIRTVGPGIAVFNGRGGLEMIDSLRAGCAGTILAPDLVDRAVQTCAAFRSGHEELAEQLYQDSLPAIVFLTQSLENLIVYGKRLFARRAGLPEVFDRRPVARPTTFGLAAVERFARKLGPFAANQTP